MSTGLLAQGSSHVGVVDPVEVTYAVDSLLPSQMRDGEGGSVTHLLKHRASVRQEALRTDESDSEDEAPELLSDDSSDGEEDYDSAADELLDSVSSSWSSSFHVPRGPVAEKCVPLSVSKAESTPAPQGVEASVPPAPMPEVGGARTNMTPEIREAWSTLRRMCRDLGIDCEEAYEMAQTGFIPELERNPHQHRPVNEPVFDQDKTAAMDILIPGLLQQQIIVSSRRSTIRRIQILEHLGIR